MLVDLCAARCVAVRASLAMSGTTLFLTCQCVLRCTGPHLFLMHASSKVWDHFGTPTCIFCMLHVPRPQKSRRFAVSGNSQELTQKLTVQTHAFTLYRTYSFQIGVFCVVATALWKSPTLEKTRWYMFLLNKNHYKRLSLLLVAVALCLRRPLPQCEFCCNLPPVVEGLVLGVGRAVAKLKVVLVSWIRCDSSASGITDMCRLSPSWSFPVCFFDLPRKKKRHNILRCNVLQCVVVPVLQIPETGVCRRRLNTARCVFWPEIAFPGPGSLYKASFPQVKHFIVYAKHCHGQVIFFAVCGDDRRITSTARYLCLLLCVTWCCAGTQD